MANTTVTVIAAGGGDYTTIQAAIDAADITSGWWKIVISDNSTYTENLSISGSVGTPSATNYVWLTVAAANRHAGQFAGTHAKIDAAAPGVLLDITEAYVRVEGLHFRRTTGTSSAVTINANNVVVSRCLFGDISPSTIGNHAIVISGSSGGVRSVSIDNCAIVGTRNTPIVVGNSSIYAVTVNIDHCTVVRGRGGGVASTLDALGLYAQTDADGGITVNTYNTTFVGVTLSGLSDINLHYISGVAGIVLNGSNNLRKSAISTVGAGVVDNSTGWQVASSGIATVSKTSGAWYVVQIDADADTGDFMLLDDAAGNLAANTGIDRTGSEPDPRQDFSTDIAGLARQASSVDIGAYQYVVDAAPAPAPIGPTITVAATATGTAPVTAQWLDLGIGIGTRSDTFRVDLLNTALSLIGTIRVDQATPPTIANNINAAIKRTMTMAPVVGEIDTLDLFAVRIRPVLILPDGSEHNLGVFLFADRSNQVHSFGSQPTVTLVDQGLIVDQPLPHAFGVTAGGSVKTAIESLLATAGIFDFVVGVDATVTSPMGWPPGTSRQKAINELARLAGGYSMYFDNNGTARVIESPDIDSPTLTYSPTSARIAAGSVVESDDSLDAPNRFIVIGSTGDANGLPAVGSYDVPTSAPHSVAHRGFVVARVMTVDGIASSAAAVIRARSWARHSSANYRWLSFASPIDPRHDTFDVVSVDYGAGASTWRQQGWAMTLRSGELMTHDLRQSW